MFDNISILIPYKAVNEYREKNLSWIKRRYEIIMPNAEICMGYNDVEPFSKSIAVNNAAKNATRDTFIIADADMVFNIDQIKNAIEALNFYSWVIPYTSIVYISPDKTNEIYNIDPSKTFYDTDFPECYKVNGWPLGGGINIVSRNNFEKVGGFDERFKGWGSEDDAFRMSLDNICGKHFNLNTTMWHLYHPQAPKDNTINNIKIFNEYYKDKETVLRNFKNKFNQG